MLLRMSRIPNPQSLAPSTEPKSQIPDSRFRIPNPESRAPVSRNSHFFQRQFQVADDVVPIFQADGQADAFRVHSEGALLLVGQGRVGHGERVLDERLDLPQANGQGDGIGVLGEVIHHPFGARLLGVGSLEHKVHHAAGGEFAVGIEHLPLGQRLLRKALGARVTDARHFGML